MYAAVFINHVGQISCVLAATFIIYLGEKMLLTPVSAE